MKKVSIKKIIIKELIPLESKIMINGWIKTRRDSKMGFSFLNINDGSCVNNLQVIANNTLENYKKDILNLTTGCSVKIIGILRISQGLKQKYELIATDIQVYGWVTNKKSYPVASKYHTMEFLRNVSHLKIRTDIFGCVSRIRSQLYFLFHQFFLKNGFVWVPTPIITTSDTEGAGELFKVTSINLQKIPNHNIDFSKDFFGKKCFLTVSGQLNAESYACGLSKVYTFGPVFRAEPSITMKHLAEFWMLEPELAFYNLKDLIKFIKKMFKVVLYKFLIKCKLDINYLHKKFNIDLFNRIESLIKSDMFQEIEYSEAIHILQKNNENFNVKSKWGVDINNEHEKFLTMHYFNKPVIIINYPTDIKPFYMRLNEDLKTVSAIDLLIPHIGEILGGSQREERLEYLEKNMKNKNINDSDYNWYKDLRKYGTIPHSGFGLGFERLLCYITGISNIKDIAPFPRMYKYANF